MLYLQIFFSLQGQTTFVDIFPRDVKIPNTVSQSQIGKQIKLCFQIYEVLLFVERFSSLMSYYGFLLGIMKLYEDSSFNFVERLCTFLFKFLIYHYTTELYWQLFIRKTLIISLIMNNYQIIMTKFHGKYLSANKGPN